MSSPSTSSSEDPDQVDNSHRRRSTHRWNHFEVRTLVCLIIKGEHLTSDDPMHIADKLNMALNPASNRNNPNYNRDIPNDDIQNMLKRILTKKMHAVDVADRDSQPTVTRTKVNAFMRSLGFDGSKDEWTTGRKEKVDVEGEERHRRYMARKDSASLSPRAHDERQRRKMMVRKPRERRLLRGWGIGASFWDGDAKDADGPKPRGKNRDSPFSGSTVTTTGNGRMSYITDSSSAPSASNGVLVNGSRGSGVSYMSTNNTTAIPSARTPNPAVAAWGGGFGPAPMPYPTRTTPLSSSIMPMQMTSASRYGYQGPGGLHAGSQQPYHSNGWNEDELWGPSGSGS